MYSQLDWDLLQQSTLTNIEVNPFLVRWFRVKTKQYLNPNNSIPINIIVNHYINSLQTEANTRDKPSHYFLHNLDAAYIPNEVIDEYNYLVSTSFFKWLGYLQTVAYFIFYDWRKYFHTWIYNRHNKEGFYKNRLLHFSHFLFIKDKYERSLVEFRTEVVAPDFSHLLLSITIGGEEFFHLSIGIGLISIYFSFHIPYLYSRIASRFSWWDAWKSYNTSINIHDWLLRFTLWHNEDYAQSDKRNWSINLENFFLGYNRYSTEEICCSYFEMKLPEGFYVGTAKLIKSTWVRDRFPWLNKSIIRCELDVPEGIPIPGKGENGWDLDDDRSYTFSSELKNSVQDSIDKWVEYITEKRVKYGGEE